MYLSRKKESKDFIPTYQSSCKTLTKVARNRFLLIRWMPLKSSCSICIIANLKLRSARETHGNYTKLCSLVQFNQFCNKQHTSTCTINILVPVLDPIPQCDHITSDYYLDSNSFRMSEKFQTNGDFAVSGPSQILTINENNKSSTSPIIWNGRGRIWKRGSVFIFSTCPRFLRWSAIISEI